MKEADLKELGFKKQKVSAEESGDKPFHYYTLYPFKKDRGFGLISNTNDQLVDGEWAVTFFEYDSVVFRSKKDLKKLIELINKNKAK